MSFAIKFLDEPVPKERLSGENVKAILGSIVIDDFEEKLEIITNYWSRDDYVKQWINAIERLDTSSDSTSVLVTQFIDKPGSPYVAELWPLYREDVTVYIQNSYLLPSKVDYPLTTQEIYKSLDKRSKGVSEWTVTINDLKAWASQLKG